ncbi:cadherin-87A isoform X2 [Bacillus rossius redtenbacheri]|uniref:cadherin-87A isoform X2 n=1 Tax=Bacillus rossius redtenbacheri TaxID=93214 RepID=UPI002FDECC58
MIGRRFLLMLFLSVGCKDVTANRPPAFSRDMDNAVVSENTPVGQQVYQLEGSDPEGSPVHYGLIGTDHLAVDGRTGAVTVARPLDREVNDTLRLTVTLEDEVPGGAPNIVRVPISVIILDDNDNSPVFKGVPYETDVPEDSPVGTTIFQQVRAEDPDVIGDALEVSCSEKTDSSGGSAPCSRFAIVTLNATSRRYDGAVVLREPLDYAKKQFHHVVLNATDGTHHGSTVLAVKVRDVQNSPPEFLGSLSGVVQEDDPIGTLVMTVRARDRDRGQPRRVTYELVTNPLDYFLLDPRTGELRTAKPLDKEALADTTGVINLTVRAREIVDGVPGNDPLTATTADATVTIKDVNDEPPTFNEREYSTVIPENIAVGTTLPHLDMTVHDPDVGSNSAFSLRLNDVSGAFAVEPATAVGSTSINIRVANGSLDYENPNQRKFIVLVIAEELHTDPKLSSTATVTVSVADTNDNAPVFEREGYAARVSEGAPGGTVVASGSASDRDSGRFGAEGLVYALYGVGSESFSVNNKTGVVSVAPCATPGVAPCLDYEKKSMYFLTLKATDNDGKGHSAVVTLVISLLDANDNSPVFPNHNYRAAIDEGANKFEPALIISARDADNSSKISYSIVEGNSNNLFLIDSHTGEITVADPKGLDMTNVTSNPIQLTIEASDEQFTTTAAVNISVRDVNNNHPVFGRESYVASVQEDTPVGTSIEQLQATDADTGMNAEISYAIQTGAFEDFAVNNETGLLTISGKLDYDRKNTYAIEVIAVDNGVPRLTGTTTVTINVLNSNDKDPYFYPATQRAEVPEDAVPGMVFYTLQAKDPDINDTAALNFAAAEPITAIDKNGRQVTDNNAFKDFFSVDQATGEVSVAKPLIREIASVVRLGVVVTDVTAPTTQEGKGILVVTIVDVNDFAPVFAKPWTSEDPSYTIDVVENQPPGTILDTFTATDADSNIEYYAIEPESDYFEIHNASGLVKTKILIDYEEVKALNFTVVAYDSGKPQKSTSALVKVNVINVNDMAPVFTQDSYEASVKENSPVGTLVTVVKATDGDEGVFGAVSYSLVGEHSSDFTVDHNSGEVKVANPGLLDREATPDVTIQVMASDGASPDTRKTTSVPVHIKLLDVNDNKPVFLRRDYPVSIVENIALSPPAPIVKVEAEDADEGVNGAVRYSIVSGNTGDVFRLDEEKGILYPAKSLVGEPREFLLVVQGRDGDGNGQFTDQATVNVAVLNVNQHKPVFIMPSNLNATVEVPESAGLPNYLVITVKAVDKDAGENGRVSYHFRVGNENKQETEEFFIDPDTGELRTKIILDREAKDKYELFLVAKDHGSPTSYETLHMLVVELRDINDNVPEFPRDGSSTPYTFRVLENVRDSKFVGKVEAIDHDIGNHALVYYYIILGNDNNTFTINKLDGSIYTSIVFDREQEDSYELYIKATNDPNYYPTKEEKSDLGRLKSDISIAQVKIIVLDENDNPPKFDKRNYYAGVNVMANVNELVTKLTATDPDLGDNGTLAYYIAASNLFKYGSSHSSGSIVPSPFNVTEAGKLLTANYMAEYNQHRFVLEVVARERAAPGREAVARVHVWIFEPEQLIRVILSRPPEEVNQERDEIVAELSNVTSSLVVVDDIRYHVDSAGQIRHDWCDMYLHVVDGSTQNIAPIPEVLKVIDAKYDFLKDYYAGFAIENVVPAFVGIREEAFDPALAALIALMVVLFVGCVTFIVVCCCLRNWIISPPSDLKKKEALIKKEIVDDLTTTENPLWIEQKLKLYEEQELTMQVFSEPENAVLTTSPQTNERRQSADFSQVDNTYATIQHPPARPPGGEDQGDYATLSGGTAHRPGSAHSSVRGAPRDMFEASLGFHGSTFQVPNSTLNPATSSTTVGQDPFGSQMALSINKHGQPEFVAELI